MISTLKISQKRDVYKRQGNRWAIESWGDCKIQKGSTNTTARSPRADGWSAYAKENLEGAGL